MIGDHPSFTHPSNRDIALWRYMDLSKFIAMLQTSSLFFARADTLGDPFEGSTTRRNALAAEYIIANRHTIENLAGWRKFTDEQILEIYQMISQSARSSVTMVYANCWHMNEHKSAAMWKLYSQSSGRGLHTNKIF